MTWLDVPDGTPFTPECLPYGVFRRPDGAARTGVAVGDVALDLAPALAGADDELSGLLDAASLDRLFAAGRPVWERLRRVLRELLDDRRHEDRLRAHLHPRSDALLPWTVADYVDFYSSEHHATNVGRMFRPDGDPLTPNWKHLPIGYHGRSGTVVVSGTDVVRPSGLRLVPGDSGPTFGPSRRLDVEVEVGWVVGTPSRFSEPVPVEAFADHVFGAVLVNDWSARDVQAFEYVPLGPFLGKSFATSVSAWVVPLEALDPARVPPPPRDPEPAAYLRDAEDRGYALDLELDVGGEVVSRPPFSTMYWTPAQQLAHMTANGASTRTGDLFASGTVSGPERDQRGSFLELCWGGKEPLPGGRTFLEDGDEPVVRGWFRGEGGARCGFGEVRGRVLPARP